MWPFSKKKETVNEAAIRAVLQQYDLSHFIESITIGDKDAKGCKVLVVLSATAGDMERLEPLRQRASDAIGRLSGVQRASVMLTAHRAAPDIKQRAERPREKLSLPHIKKIIAVASGKGGVGKSTTSVNLAVALAQCGLKVGLVDADIYGPSIPRMMGVIEKPQTTENKKMMPLLRHGISAMSMGFLVAEETPMIWRGPMVHTAIQQLFRDVDWGERDVLVVDLPPGTGDAQLTLTQNIPLSGAIIVSTPQDIALIDARKAIAMFQKTDVPILGLIENMSTFSCPHCGHETDIFGHGGVEREAQKIGMPFLGSIPLELDIREQSDAGMPVAAQQSSKSGMQFMTIAQQIKKQLFS